jgi:ribose transport system permease protein
MMRRPGRPAREEVDGQMSTTTATVRRVDPRLVRPGRLVLDNLVWLILAGALVVFSVSIPYFASSQNYINIVYHAVFIGMLAIAQTLCLVSGQMDLSVESVAGFSAILSAYLAGSSRFASGLGLDPYLTLLVVMLLGGAVGAANAFFVARLRINPFLVTLATYIMVRGLALSLTEGRGVTALPESFRWVDQIEFQGISLMVFLMIACYALFLFVLLRTRFGRHLYLIGGNANAAQNFGVNVRGTLYRVFIISGALSALTGWLITARSDGATPAAATGFLFEVLAACVIGGVSLTGGVGTLVGVFAGVLLLSAIHTALNMMAISPFVADVVRGALVLLAVVLDTAKRAIDPYLVARPEAPR